MQQRVYGDTIIVHIPQQIYTQKIIRFLNNKRKYKYLSVLDNIRLSKTVIYQVAIIQLIKSCRIKKQHLIIKLAGSSKKI